MLRPASASGAAVALALLASVGQALPGIGAVPPGQVWAAELGPGEAGGVAVNLAGETFVAGGGLGGGVVWKLDALGQPQWSRAVALTSPVVAAFPDTGAVVAGGAWGDDGDVVVMALDGQGGTAWSRVIGYDGPDAARAVAADVGAVFVAGSNGLDGLVARLDPDGTHRWSERVATGAEDRLEAVALLPDGGVVVAGWSYDGVRNKALAARLDAFGNLQWLRILAWEGLSLRAYAVAATPQGDIAVAGLKTHGLQQWPWLARLDAHGKLLWQRALDTERGAAATGLASDLGGGLIVAGHGPGPFGQRDAWLARFTPGGGLVWSHRHDHGGDDGARGLAWLPSGLITLGGSSSGTLVAARFADAPVRPVA